MDDEALRVEADRLLDAGDLRGELIQVQLALAALGEGDAGDRDGDADARFTLEGRELQLLTLLRPRLRLEGQPARGEIVHARGVAAELILHEVAWDRIDALIALVRDRAPACRALVLHDARSWVGVGALAAALPSLVSFELRDRYPTQSGGRIDRLFAARAAQLESLSIEVHPWTRYELTRALASTELPRLRRLALSGGESAGLLDAVEGRLPALDALELGGGLGEDGTVELRRLLGLARRPLRELSASGRFTLDEICRLVSAPESAALESLRLSGECDGLEGGATVSMGSTPVEALILQRMSGAAVEELSRRLAAPRLRRLTLHQPTPATLQSAWLDGVTSLTLEGRIDASTLRPAPRRPTRLRALTLALDGADSSALVQPLELSSLRRLEIRATSLYGADAGDLDAFRWMEAPRVRALRLVGAISDEILAALAEWPTAPALRIVELVTTAELSGRAVDLLVDDKRFAQLGTLALGPWTKVDPDHLPRLVARFGPGLARAR